MLNVSVIEPSLMVTVVALFAAAVPICGAGDPTKAELIKDMPIWFFHGDQDPTVTVQAGRTMADALEGVGSTQYYYYEYPGVDHYAWTPAYKEEMLLPWLFSHTKAAPVETTPATEETTEAPDETSDTSDNTTDAPTTSTKPTDNKWLYIGATVFVVGVAAAIAVFIGKGKPKDKKD